MAFRKTKTRSRSYIIDQETSDYIENLAGGKFEGVYLYNDFYWCKLADDSSIKSALKSIEKDRQNDIKKNTDLNEFNSVGVKSCLVSHRGNDTNPLQRSNFNDNKKVDCKKMCASSYNSTLKFDNSERNSVGKITPKNEVKINQNNELTFTKMMELGLTSKKDYLLVGFDTEFIYNGDDRFATSYQFSFLYGDKLERFIVFSKNNRPLSLQDDFMPFLAERYPEYAETGRYLYRDYPKDSNKKPPSMNVIFLAHFTIADITTFRESDMILRNYTNNLNFTKYPVIINRVYKNFSNPLDKNSGYKMSLSVIDTQNLADGKSKLSNLGELIGLEKLKLKNEEISHMDILLKDNPNLYIDYAIRDADIALCYYYSLFGTKKGSPTLPAVASKVAQHIIMEENAWYGKDGTEQFKNKFRGVKTLKTKEPDEIKGFVFKENEVPLNAAAENISLIASQSYHAGYNAAMKMGYYKVMTYDYDLKNAYPTGMMLVDEIDYENPNKHSFEPNKKLSEVDKELLVRELLKNGAGYGYANIKFPKTCKYPNIFQRFDVSGSQGLCNVLDNKLVPVSLIDVVFAIALGAEIEFVHTGFQVFNTMKTMSLSKVASKLIHLRSDYQSYDENGIKVKNTKEQTIKLGTNSIYGKLAQNVVGKTSVNMEKTYKSIYNPDEMEDEMREYLTGSSFTSPHHASSITAWVRGILCLTMQTIEDMGYNCYSVTTDGFISDCPEDVLLSLPYKPKDPNNLIEMTSFMLMNKFLDVRESLDGERSMWERKHYQEELLNITTRINMGFGKKGYEDGVAALIGFKSDSDKNSIAKKYFERGEKGVFEEYDTFVNASDILNKQIDFSKVHKKVHLKMKYDMKRRPINPYLESVTLDGNTYSVENYDTLPFENIEDLNNVKQYWENKYATYSIFNITENFDEIKKSVKKDSNNKNKNAYKKDFISFLSVMRCSTNEDFRALWTYTSYDEALEDLSKFQEALGENYIFKITKNHLKNSTRNERYKKQFDEDSDVLKLLSKYQKHKKAGK